MVYIAGLTVIVVGGSFGFLTAEALGMAYGLPGYLLAWPISFLASSNLARLVHQAAKQF